MPTPKISTFKKHDLTPDWVLYVVRFKNQVTADLSKIKSLSSHIISVDKPPDFALEELGEPLIIRNDCLGLSVNSSKSSHNASMQAQLAPGKNYLKEIKPGDWICAWVSNKKSTIDAVVANLQKKQPANQENSGLKFVGRVGGVRKSVSIGPNRTKKTAYTVTSHAFTEFNNEIFYHPLAAVKGEQQNVISEWQRKLGLFIGNKITTDATGTGLESRHMIPPILDMALGRGIGMSIPGALEASPNTQIPCRIPASIAKILGVGSVPTPTYRDILEIIIGSKIQKPRNSVTQPI